MRQIICFLACYLLLIVNSVAQENTPISFYSLNPQVLNPALLGVNGGITGFLTNRTQWHKLDGLPKYTVVGLHGEVSDGVGVGLNVSSSTIGYIKELSVKGGASYGIELKEGNKLRFGLFLGFVRAKLDYIDDGISNYSDPSLESSYFDKALFKSGFGVSYKVKELQVDVSLPSIYEATNKKYFQTIIAYAGYGIKVESSDLEITPGILYRNSPLSFSQVDATVKVELKEMVWAQVGFRNTSGVIVGAGLKRNGLAVGYVYEIDNSRLSSASSGSHEISLFIDIIKKE